MNHTISSMKQCVKQRYTKKRQETTKVDKTLKGRAREVEEKNKSFSITETKNTWKRNDIAENPVRDM